MRFAWLATVTGALLAQSGEAAVIQSLDRATFQAALAASSNIGSQNFDSLASGSLLTNDGFITYSSSSGTPQVTNAFLTSTSPNGLGHTGIGYFVTSDTLLLTFSTEISAFAIDFNTFATQDGSYSALLNTGDTVLSRFEAFSGISTGQFIGFVSDTPFSSVLIGSGASGASAFSLDTLVYGDSEDVTSVVPEPATWAMMLVGFGMIGATARYRRRSSVRYA